MITTFEESGVSRTGLDARSSPVVLDFPQHSSSLSDVSTLDDVTHKGFSANRKSAGPHVEQKENREKV